MEGVARLPESYRAPFVLRDLEELPTAEVGEILGLEPATVTLTVTIVADGAITNSATATSPELDPTPMNATATASLMTASVLEVPTLGPWALLLLVLALTGAGIATLRG